MWLRLAEKLNDLREPRALPGWLATTASREAIRLLNTRARTVPADPLWPVLDGPSDDADVGAEVIAAERRRALREAFKELSDERRALIVLLLEDPPVSYQEISRRLGIPVGSIGPTKGRIVEQLRHSKALRPYFDAGPNEPGGGQDDEMG